MTDVLLTTVLVVMVVVFVLLLWLSYEHKKLKQTCRELEEAISRNSKDIAGICSAAVSVDSRLQGNDDQLKNLVAKLTDTAKKEQQNNHSSQPYHSAINKIHSGAGPDELVRECGLSHDEAVLLISLHGLKK